MAHVKTRRWRRRAPTAGTPGGGKERGLTGLEEWPPPPAFQNTRRCRPAHRFRYGWSGFPPSLRAFARSSAAASRTTPTSPMLQLHPTAPPVCAAAQDFPPEGGLPGQTCPGVPPVLPCPITLRRGVKILPALGSTVSFH